MRRSLSLIPLILGGICITCVLAAREQSSTLKYGRGQPDGKKSLGGSGEMIQFTMPAEGAKVSGIRIHGSRYGTPQAPEESFLIYFLSQDLSEVSCTEMAPYSLFERGGERCVEIRFRRPLKVPRKFWVALDFRAYATKGVYVSYDTSTDGKFSRVGLPGIPAAATDFGGDWMIQVLLAK
jgi:RNA polymerase sigma-70 factor (ECF subfamily)